jgi:hypothetical protein
MPDTRCWLWQWIDAKLDEKRDFYARSVAGLQSRNAKILCARCADPLIAHDFEAESLALIQAGHSCAFDGAYVDQHVNATVVGLDETIALRDVETPYGSNCHSRPPAHQATSPRETSANDRGRPAVRGRYGYVPVTAGPRQQNPLLKTAWLAEV